MDNQTYLINCTNPHAYVDSLQALGNKKHKLCNGYELAYQRRDVKTNSQIFIKDDLHFYRTDSSVTNNINLNIRQEEVDHDYIDFRIDNLGRTSSMIEDKSLQLQSKHDIEQSLHIFLKKELLEINKETFEIKQSNAHRCSNILKLSEDILSIPATGNRNALLIEGKLLEMSYVYLDYLHTPTDDAPAFLSIDYKVNCILKAREIITEEFVNPPNIKLLSRQVGINTKQLKIGFKYLFNTTIRQHVINLRLIEAQHLVTTTQLSLGQISNRVGYVNHGHFSKLYKKKFGLSPLAERRM